MPRGRDALLRRPRRPARSGLVQYLPPPTAAAPPPVRRAEILTPLRRRKKQRERRFPTVRQTRPAFGPPLNAKRIEMLVPLQRKPKRVRSRKTVRVQLRPGFPATVTPPPRRAELLVPLQRKPRRVRPRKTARGIQLRPGFPASLPARRAELLVPLQRKPKRARARKTVRVTYIYPVFLLGPQGPPPPITITNYIVAGKPQAGLDTVLTLIGADGSNTDLIFSTVPDAQRLVDVLTSAAKLMVASRGPDPFLTGVTTDVARIMTIPTSRLSSGPATGSDVKIVIVGADGSTLNVTFKSDVDVRRLAWLVQHDLIPRLRKG